MKEKNDQASQLLQLEVGMPIVTQGMEGRVGNTMTRMFLGTGYVWIQLPVVIGVSLQIRNIRSRIFMQMT